MFEWFRVLPKHQQCVFILCVTISLPFALFLAQSTCQAWRRTTPHPLQSANKWYYMGGVIYCTYQSIAGQRKITSKCICCFSFLSTPNSRYCCSIASFITCSSKGFCKLKADGRTRINDRHEGKCTYFAIFWAGRRRRGRRSVWAGDFSDFRCESRTLWFFTLWTLCFPTLGWILSPRILYPRWACTSVGIVVVNFSDVTTPNKNKYLHHGLPQSTAT